MSTTQLSLSELEEMAERLRSMGHPIRLAMVEMLANEGSANVTSIHSKLDIEQATASHHLRILRTANVVKVQRVGKSSVYSLKNEQFAKVFEFLA